MKWSDLLFRSAHESVGELERADPWFRDPFFRGMVGGEEGVWEELDTAMGSGGALYRQQRRRGSRRGAHLRVMCDLEGSRGNLVGDSRVALGGSTFSVLHLRCISNTFYFRPKAEVYLYKN